jgi:hypothetical protein
MNIFHRARRMVAAYGQDIKPAFWPWLTWVILGPELKFKVYALVEKWMNKGGV